MGNSRVSHQQIRNIRPIIYGLSYIGYLKVKIIQYLKILVLDVNLTKLRMFCYLLTPSYSRNTQSKMIHLMLINRMYVDHFQNDISGGRI